MYISLIKRKPKKDSVMQRELDSQAKLQQIEDLLIVPGNLKVDKFPDCTFTFPFLKLFHHSCSIMQNNGKWNIKLISQHARTNLVRLPVLFAGTVKFVLH